MINNYLNRKYKRYQWDKGNKGDVEGKKKKNMKKNKLKITKQKIIQPLSNELDCVQKIMSY